MRRVAVLGVPRGGTSLVVGLLRILGYQLPPGNTSCLLGESRIIRWAGSPLQGDIDLLVPLIDALPDGVVWKDPAVALYADRIDWTGWDVIRVTRNPVDVAASEARWQDDPVDQQHLAERACDWAARLDAVPALETFEASWVRAAPQIALDGLSRELRGSAPTRTQQALTHAFVHRGGGYRCPLPETCPLPEPAHTL